MPELYIGLMSGTSMDAVDAALVDLEHAPTLVATHSEPISESLRQDLRALAQGEFPNELEHSGRLDVHLAERFAATALAVVKAAGRTPDEIRAIGSHGQTVRHRPAGPYPFSLQIGDPNVIAERTGITTVADFRRRDLAAGGQGAPLAPAFHNLVFRSPEEDRVVLNLGGIANITHLPRNPAAPVIGFDTGPGNVLMDAWCARHVGDPYDDGGEWAGTGRVCPGLLMALLADPYFAQPAPKSTGREHFHMAWLEQALATQPEPLRAEDVQATLAELTAVSVTRAVHQHAPEPQRLLVCGGGAANRGLLARIQRHARGCAVESTAAWGLDPKWVEAAAFAWLAYQTLRAAPGNLPSVTGAQRPVVLGGIYVRG
ncbi:MAG: anhydro-N-acetylmuramic acid kinase [Gammaproteobacteria bacterium]